MMQLLLISPFMPAQKARQAGHRIVFETLEKLSESNEVTLVLILPQKEEVPPELHKICSGGLYTIYVSRFEAIISWILEEPCSYPRFLTRFSKKALTEVFDIFSSKKFDEIRCEFTQTFIYGYYLRKRFPDLRVVLSAHDIFFQAVLRKQGFEKYFCVWTRNTERTYLRAADEVLVLTNKDKMIIESVLDVGVNICVTPPKLSPFFYHLEKNSLISRQPNTLLFWGAMNRIENERAVLRFIDHVLSRLHQSGCFYKLYVVGSNPGHELIRRQSEYVTVTGFVEDPVKYFQMASIGIVPLEMGAGLKLKTLEMLHAGIPCILSTPVGAEGVFGTEGNLVVRDFDRFFNELIARYVR